MFRLIHFLVFAICAFEILSSMSNLRANFVRIVLMAGLGLIHGLVPMLTPRDMMFPGASDSSVSIAALMALLGVVMFSAGWHLADRKHRLPTALSPAMEAWLALPGTQRALSRLFWACAVLGVGIWLVSLVASAGSVGAAFSAGRFQYRASGNIYLNAFLNHAQAVLLVPGFLGFFLQRRHLIFGVVFALTMAVLWYFAHQGTRVISMGLLGAALMGYVLRYEINVRRFAMLSAAGVGFVLLAVASYHIRHVMKQTSKSDLGRMLLSAETYENLLAQDPLNYHQFLVATVEHFPRDHGYVNGATYWRLLVFFVPRAYFPSIKPADTNNIFAQTISGRMSDVTIPPTLIGDGYINFWGAPGVIIVMFMYGLLFGHVARRFRERPGWFLILGPSFMKFSLLAVRGQPYELLTSALSTAMITWVFCVVFGLPLRRARAWVNQADQMYRLNAPPTPAQLQPAAR